MHHYFFFSCSLTALLTAPDHCKWEASLTIFDPKRYQEFSSKFGTLSSIVIKGTFFSFFISIKKATKRQVKATKKN